MAKLIALLVLWVVLTVLPDALSRRHHSHRSKSERSNHHKAGGKIVGGEEITIEQAPFMATLSLVKGNNRYLCGGTILNNRYILTAAHCLDEIDRAEVRVGSKYYSRSGTVHQSELLTPHPMYNKRNHDYDVGIIRLRSTMTLDNKHTKAVGLPNENDSLSTFVNLTVYGWGLTKEDGRTSQILQRVKVPVVATSKCRKAYGSISERQFCAGDTPTPKDSCQGDSGGPAVSDSNVQRGIVSFGFGCARKGYPGVYTDVAKVRSFIRTTAGL